MLVVFGFASITKVQFVWFSAFFVVVRAHEKLSVFIHIHMMAKRKCSISVPFFFLPNIPVFCEKLKKSRLLKKKKYYGNPVLHSWCLWNGYDHGPTIDYDKRKASFTNKGSVKFWIPLIIITTQCPTYDTTLSCTQPACMYRGNQLSHAHSEPISITQNKKVLLILIL
jgi:hypothetical protein